MSGFTRILVGFTVACLSLQSAVAQEQTAVERFPDDDVLRLDMSIEITKQPDGGVVVIKRMSHMALTEAGREKLQDYEFQFNKAYEELHVERACTLGMDGREACATPEQIFVEPEEDAEVIEGVWEPHRVTVLLTEMMIGSITELELRTEIKQHRWFSKINAMSDWGPSERVEVVVRHPQNQPFCGRAVGAEAAYERSEVDGMEEQSWTFGPQPAPPKDTKRPSNGELSPSLFLSEFETWQQFVDWYEPHIAEARDRFSGGPAREVLALADADVKAMDPVLRMAFLVEDRTEHSDVWIKRCTLIPGKLKTIVKETGTLVERAVALQTLLLDAGVEGVHLALSTNTRNGVPGDFPCPMAFQKMGVYVDGRGFIDPDTHADYVDTIPSYLHGGTLVILDPAGPRSLVGEELTDPEAINGYHRTGQLFIENGNLRVDEDIQLTGAEGAEARSYWRRYQEDIEKDEKSDRKTNRLYQRYFVEREGANYVERGIWDHVKDHGYAQGHVSMVAMFDPWDLEAETAIHVRYTPEDAVETKGNLMLVRLPFVLGGVSTACAKASSLRDAPVEIMPTHYTYRWELIIPEGFQVLGLPKDRTIESEYASLSIQFREETVEIRPLLEADGADDGEEPEAPAEPVQGRAVIIEAELLTPHNRIPVEAFDEFRAVKAQQLFTATDPIVFSRSR